MRTLKSLAVLVLAVVVLTPGVAGATHPTVGLGNADSFAVLAGETVTNTGPTVVNGDLGVSPGTAVTGDPTVNGSIHTGPTSLAADAQLDLTTAYNDAAGRACTTDLTGEDLGGETLTAGVYCFSSSAGLTGTLTLNAEGDPDAVFIFQIGSTLITAPGSSVAFINGAQACNVFWQVGSSATLDTTTSFRGSILALESIAARAGATVEGRLLARGGEVTLINNTITRPTCSHGDTNGDTTNGDTTNGDTTNGATPDGDLPVTGDRLPTAPTLVLGTYMILIGLLYNFLGSSSSRLALAVRGYQPKRRARP